VDLKSGPMSLAAVIRSPRGGVALS